MNEREKQLVAHTVAKVAEIITGSGKRDFRNPITEAFKATGFTTDSPMLRGTTGKAKGPLGLKRVGDLDRSKRNVDKG